MVPFLWQVARHYLDTEGLEDYCFVFPNRRSGQFFTHYMQQQFVAASSVPHLMPCVTTINELVAEMTGTLAATDIEMMFALYDAYCQAMGDAAQEFDKFIYWAQLIVSDFNDIDRSLADAVEIYRNLDDLHRLSSNYLSPEVQEKVRKIFGDDLFTSFFDTSADAGLWQQRAQVRSSEGAGPTDDSVMRQFMSLWNALGTIYKSYHQALAEREVLAPGYQLRQAAEGSVKELPYQRMVFVGFGVLSAAEVKIFERFRLDGKADFWWDNIGLKALLDKAPHDPGALLIDGYCKRFGAMPIEPLGGQQPHIRVMAVSSTVGQAKVAFDEVRRLHQDTSSTGIETAIVLPDENLLVPLLHSVNSQSALNVTLGYPLRSSGIVSLMHIVARMHHQATKEHGELTYYREDVYDIMSHPLIKSYFTDEALAMVTELRRTNRFRVPAKEFMEMSFYPLFVPAMDSESTAGEYEKQAGYLDNLLQFCDLLMGRMATAPVVADEDASEVQLPLQQAFLAMYTETLHQLKQALAANKRSLLSSTVFYLIDRLSASAIVPFTGEPLEGLQIMGLLETRSLDFKNVIILSMNERVFPRHRSINSFIPNYIRRAHGMSTTEQQEAIVAFNFYRLLNRAANVTLIYDSSAQKMGSSEPSRYIMQLEKVYGYPIEHVELAPAIHTSSPVEIEVPNHGFDDLRAHYLSHHEKADEWYLSASAINKYINCPLMFYMHYVQGLNDDDEMSDFMDSGTFGTIVHDTLADCYNAPDVRARGGLVDKDYITAFKRDRLDAAVVRNIKKTYMHVPVEQLDTDTQVLTGEPYMLIDTIKSYVGFVLDHDLALVEQQGPFTVIECEVPHRLKDMPIGDTTLNFTYTPDRIDRLANGTVRIVDYKTGADVTSFSGIDALFKSSKDRRKAILQIFLYCHAYLTKHTELDSVMPVIYKLSSMKESGVFKSASKGRIVNQIVYSKDDPDAQEFILRMQETVKSLKQDPFKQAPEGAPSCGYCHFIDFCRRTVAKEK